jgi:3-dehydroquinate dehydratase
MYDKSEKDALMVESVDRAIRKTAEKILEKAKQTHTSVVIWENDQIKEIPPEEMEMRLNARLSLDASS